MDQREVFLQLLADDDADGGGVTAGELARGVLELRRPHVVRRRVDEVARQRHRLDDAFHVRPIEARRQIELDVASVRLAVAREAVSAEREGERRQTDIVRIVGEAVGSRRQLRREAPGLKQILRLVGAFEPEQNTGQAALARQQQQAPGLGLEPRRIGKARGVRIEPPAQLGIALGRDEPDRNCVRGFAGDEDRLHRDVHPLQAPTARATR